MSGDTPQPSLLGDSPTRGILLVIGTTLFISMLDGCTKYLGQSYPVPMVVWARYFFHFAIFGIPTLGRLGKGAYHTRRLGLHVFRAALLACMTGLFVLALTTIPLAEATAISFLYPILVLVLSVLFFGERAGPWRWSSVMIGFAGVLVIIRPGMTAIEPGMIYALAMACCYAVYQITTRSLNRTERPATTLFYTAAVGTLISTLVVPWFWTLPTSLLDGALMVLMGLVGGMAHLLIIQAFRYASPAMVAPFFYVQMIFVSLVEYLVFGDLPDGWTILGAAMISVAGIVIWLREHGLRQNSVDMESPTNQNFQSNDQ